jgi:hypothetical protein
LSRIGVLVSVVALAFLASACGSDSSSGGGSSTAGGSCTLPSSGGCDEWSSTFAGAVQTACNQSGGTYSSGACSSSGRVGRCAFTTSGTGAYTYTISYYTGTAASLQAACNQLNGQGGITTVWTAG